MRILLVFFILISATLPAFALPCDASNVRVDLATRKVYWTLSLEGGGRSYRIAPKLGNYGLKWKLYKGGTSGVAIIDAVLKSAGRPAKVELVANIPSRSERVDRQYPSSIEFSDGTIALYSENFRLDDEHLSFVCTKFFALNGGQVFGYGIGNVTTLIGSVDVPSYVAFGSAHLFRRGKLAFVLDRNLPDWIRNRIVDVADASISYYERRLGREKYPLIFVYGADSANGSYHWGDRLPGSITLGLYGKEWNSFSLKRRSEIDNFLRHELFHIWNGIPKARNDGSSLLAVEGGAEFANAILRSRSEYDSAPVLLSVSEALNRCSSKIIDGSSLQELLSRSSPGGVPYDCGMLYMFIISQSGLGRGASYNDFFNGWRRLNEEFNGKAYTWTDLAPPMANKSILDDLVRAESSTVDFLKLIESALSREGYQLKPAPTWSKNQVTQAAGKILASLMAMDCEGSVSFWSVDEGFQLDSRLPKCHSLKQGRLVTTIMGLSLRRDPVALANKINVACSAGVPIVVGYGGAESGTSSLKCKAAIGPVSVPFFIKKRSQ